MIFKREKKSAPTEARPRVNNIPQMQYSYNTSKARILQALKGAEYVKRYELRDITGLADTRLRGMLAEMQMNGTPIINMQDGRGYKLARTEEELDAYKAQETARATQILRKVRAMTLEG